MFETAMMTFKLTFNSWYYLSISHIVSTVFVCRTIKSCTTTWHRKWTNAHVLHFTRHCTDMLQERLIISMSFLFQIYWSIMCQ